MKCGTSESHPSIARIDPATPIINQSKKISICLYTLYETFGINSKMVDGLFYIDEYLMKVTSLYIL